ncbi:MAG TPA: zinc-dependent alcohol dehydrogenase [Lacipirellulaceae bacterium]|nr:zinc-dependent alcohol dehydrogenase [Lacipirellulaceae bacterium]
MKAVVFHDVGDIRLDDVPEPTIKESTDAIIKVTASAICGTDLHFVRGTVSGMKPGTILGHEAVGTVADVGQDVHNLSPGDRVVVAPTISCGSCSYCRDGYFGQCDHANPNGPRAGTAFFGGPASSGSFDGLQAELARIPFANVGLVKLPDTISNEEAILLSDIFPSGYFGADLAEIVPGDVVAVFGCGPVGQFAILSAFLMGAGRVLAVDNVPERLDTARGQGAEVVNFDSVNPVQALLELTRGIGPDRIIDAVGVDARSPQDGSSSSLVDDEIARIERQRSQVCDDLRLRDQPWLPGDAPMQALLWAVASIAKSGTLSIIGVYPPQFESFPLGAAFDRNVTINMGMCHHRRYIPKLIQLVASGEVDPTLVRARQEPLIPATEAYESLDRRQHGWLQVELVPPR